jgi:hypothetical protein
MWFNEGKLFEQGTQGRERLCRVGVRRTTWDLRERHAARVEEQSGRLVISGRG